MADKNDLVMATSIDSTILSFQARTLLRLRKLLITRGCHFLRRFPWCGTTAQHILWFSNTKVTNFMATDAATLRLSSVELWGNKLPLITCHKLTSYGQQVVLILVAESC